MSIRVWVMLAGLASACLSVSGRTQLKGAEGFSYCECYFEVFNASKPGTCDDLTKKGEVDETCLLSFTDRVMYMGDMGPHKPDSQGSQPACTVSSFGAAEIYSGKQPPYETCDQFHYWESMSCNDKGGDYMMKLDGTKPVCKATKKEDDSEVNIMDIPKFKKAVADLLKTNKCYNTKNSNVRLVCFPSTEKVELNMKESNLMDEYDMKIPTKEEAMERAGADAMCEGPCYPPDSCELIQEDDSKITLEEMIENLGFTDMWEWWKDPSDTPPKLPDGFMDKLMGMIEGLGKSSTSSGSSPSHPAAPEWFDNKKTTIPSKEEISKKIIEMFTKLGKAQDVMLPIYSDKCKGPNSPYATSDSCDAWRTCKDEKDPFSTKDAYDEKEAMEMSNMVYQFVTGKDIPKKIKGINQESCTIRCGPAGILGLPTPVFFGGIAAVVAAAVAIGVGTMMCMKKKKAAREEEEDDEEEEDWGEDGKTGGYDDFNYSEAQY